MSDYWEKQNQKPDVESWLSFRDGCIWCACDHGCNQWLKENQTKASMIIRTLKRGSPSSADKIAQMDVKRVDRLWGWFSRREARKLNRLMDSTPSTSLKLLEAKAREMAAEEDRRMGRYMGKK